MNQPDVRERIARIVDPKAFRDAWPGCPPGIEKLDTRKAALAKADTILATLSPGPLVVRLVEALKDVVAAYAMNNAEPAELLAALRPQIAGACAAIAEGEAALLSTGLASGDQGTSGASLPAHVAEDATATEAPGSAGKGEP